MRVEEPITIPVEKPRALRQMTELYGIPIDYQKMASHLNLPLQFVKQVFEAHAEKISLSSQEREISNDQLRSQRNNIVHFGAKQRKSL